VDPAAHLNPVAWESFYIIVGSSAGALTGLQFVVMTLIADVVKRPQSPAIAAFGTPTIFHFCAALVVSALLSAPWSSLPSAGLAVAACGLSGVVYTAIVVKRARRQREYQPVLEDWIWHLILPFVGYAGLLVAGLLLGKSAGPALDLIAGASLLLVLIGIHNAWDAVTYIALTHRKERDQT
jgi:hypothetical protein